jgi:hypothetical protein
MGYVDTSELGPSHCLVHVRFPAFDNSHDCHKMEDKTTIPK